MTTAQSPLPVLEEQARRMAAMLKRAERGEKIGNDPAGKIAASRKTDGLKTGIVMDDKVITIELTWKTIRETSQAGIAEYILNLMRDARDTVQ